MRIKGGIILAMAAITAASGCARMNRDPADCFVNDTDAARYEHGLVVCLGGAGGMMGHTDDIRKGLLDGGVDSAIEVFDWSSGLIIFDQMDIKTNKRKAKALARRIERYQRQYPGRPVHLIGVSAGTGLLVWALEDMGPQHRVDSAFLIAPSLWWKYDLSPAMKNVNGHLYAFHSPLDAVLALLVPIVGTVDRINGISGGLHGFSLPDETDGQTKSLYDSKLAQIAWQAKDTACGHIGNHLGATQPAYVSERIAPLVRGPEPHPMQNGDHDDTRALATVGGMVIPKGDHVRTFPPRHVSSGGV